MLLTCDHSKQASSSVLPIAYPSLAGTGIQPGRSVFVGQYLFTGEQQLLLRVGLLGCTTGPRRQGASWKATAGVQC